MSGTLTKASTVLAAALLLAITGCASTSTTASAPQTQQTVTAPAPSPTASMTASSTPNSMPTWKAEPAGMFSLKSKSGAVITFTLPTPATNPSVAPIEAYRVKTGAAPVTYIVADVDNRNGSQLVNMYKVMAFDRQGHEYSFSTVADAIGLWQPAVEADGTFKMPNGTSLGDATGTALYNEGVNLENANNSDTEVGARKTVVLAAQGASLPSEFTRVAVMPSGAATEVEATPAP